MSWNPTAPAVVGLEWPVNRQGGVRLNRSDAAAVARVASSAVETITKARLYLSPVVGSLRLRADVYTAGAVPQVITTTVFRPNEDVTIANLAGVPTDTAGNRYTNIDEATLDETDYLRYSSGASPRIDFRVASGAAVTPYVNAVRVKAKASNTDGLVRPLTAGFNLGGVNYVGDTLDIAGNNDDGVVTLSWETTVNPATGQRWTQADIRALDTSDEVYLTWNNSTGIRVFQAWIEVDHQPAPAAVGTVDVDAAGWHEVTFSASWAKTVQDYLVIVSRDSGTGEAVYPSLDSGEAMPMGHGAHRATLSEILAVDDLSDELTEAHPLVLVRSDAAVSVDSQPYARLAREPVYAGRTVQQELTPATTLTRGWVQPVVARQGSRTDGDLVVRIKQRSNNTQKGGDATITAADVVEAVRTLRPVGVNLASTGSVSNVQHYVELSSEATDGQGWEVAVLDTVGQTKSFGETTDAATVAGVESTDLDAPVLIGTVPSTVAGVSAA